jgi:hypothetical protein
MNVWSEDSEEEYNKSSQDNPLPLLDETFRNNIVALKHHLYDKIVLSPTLGTKNAQSNDILYRYLDTLDKMYLLCVNAEEGGDITEDDLLVFPKETREMVRVMLHWIRDFFHTNQYSITVPYSDYLEKSFREYPFVQTNTFNE